jgi:pyrroloquinoline quinone biosynthesis protein B
MLTATLLGSAQDGGVPQAGCHCAHCAAALADRAFERLPVSLALRAPSGVQLFEATRELARQLALAGGGTPAAIWLTHAHLGHIDGLGQFGAEVMDARGVPLHCSPAVAERLRATPGWRALLDGGHLRLREWRSGEPVAGDGFAVTPLPVPHRSEAGDTHALLVAGKRKLLFLPDHDSWDATLAAVGAASPRDWLRQLGADIVLLDGTFWSADELPRQDAVPHPPVAETLERLGAWRKGDPRVVFIHLNHTNPLCNPDSGASAELARSGWEVGREGQTFSI